MTKTNILFYGDSIFERAFTEEYGFGHLLNSGLSGKANLINCGVGGDKIYDLVIRFDKDISPLDLDIIIVNTGTNDVNHKFEKHTGTDRGKYKKYLDLLLTKLKTAAPHVILCPAAVGGENISDTNPRNLEHDAYAEIASELCKKHEVIFCDIRNAFKRYLSIHNPDNHDSGILTFDRVHLNASGNKLYAESLMPCIENYVDRANRS